MIKISASTHPAKLNYLNYVIEVEKAGVDMIHCDVMDGKFVKDVAFSHYDVANINRQSTIVLDVHLMVQNPKPKIAKYARAGANILTIHYEAIESKKDIKKALLAIKKHHMLVGLSVKPSTPLEKIKELLPYLDLVLIMSVEPGKSGQAFLEESTGKIKALKQMILEDNYNILIEVDGGVNESNIHLLKQAGADIVVVGNYLFTAKNKKQAIQLLKA